MPEQGSPLEVVEICAGAGGQLLGLERAGFRHRLAIELDQYAEQTLLHNLVRVLGYSKEEAKKVVRKGDVADPLVWSPDDHKGIDLLAGGVPCPPFSIAGKQLGASDERDLFAWAVELCGRMEPKALLLENVKGLSQNRFTAYRHQVLKRLDQLGYVAEWKLLQASDYGVSQLRPRFVLVALRPEYFEYFAWPEPNEEAPKSVGELLRDLMGKGDWTEERLDAWVEQANNIAPTIVGGSKKHGGADLGPTRAKAAWKELGVDAKGVADDPPGPTNPRVKGAEHPMLTVEMVAQIQGWYGEEFQDWEFKGGKTSKYRQIGNAFPPPVAKALGKAIRDALEKSGDRKERLVTGCEFQNDHVYQVLIRSKRPLGAEDISKELNIMGVSMEPSRVERHLNQLENDFNMETVELKNGIVKYGIGEFKAFLGQEDHVRHERFADARSKVS